MAFAFLLDLSNYNTPLEERKRIKPVCNLTSDEGKYIYSTKIAKSSGTGKKLLIAKVPFLLRSLHRVKPKVLEALAPEQL